MPAPSTLGLRPVLFLASFGLAAPIVGQTVVSGGGSSLQTAISAAAIGDELVVQAGTYDPILITQGITIEFQTGASVVSNNAMTAVEIRDVNAGALVRLRGGSFIQNMGPGTSTITIQQVDGSVFFDGTVAIRAFQDPIFGVGINASNNLGRLQFDNVDEGLPLQLESTHDFDNCEEVTFNNCSNLSPMRLFQTTAAMVDSDIPLRDSPGNNLPRAALDILFSNLQITGGFFGSAFSSQTCTPLQSAVLLTESEVRISGGATLEKRVGIPTVLDVSALGTIRGLQPFVDPSVTIIESAGRTSVTTMSETPAVRTSLPNPATLDIDVAGGPNRPIITVVGAPTTPINTFEGTLWITSPVAFDARVLPAVNPNFTISVPLPPGLPSGLELTFQAFMQQTAGNFVLSAPARFLSP
ncbi:MAG: hypothetical protein AAF196_02615 [Planctomycetota bacterium]